MANYNIFGKSGSVERSFDGFLNTLNPDEKKKLLTTLARFPKGVPREQRTENTGRVEKKGKFYQYYGPGGQRVIYDVKDRPKQVIVQFPGGNHEDARIWLRDHP